MIKAGIMEIGDLFVVNKKDRPGVERVMAEIRTALELSEMSCVEGSWVPPILLTMAETGEGVAEVVDACGEHLKHLEKRDWPNAGCGGPEPRLWR